MAITYTWSIRGILKAPSLNGLNDVITSIMFNYTGVSDEVDAEGNPYTHTFNGQVPASPPPEDVSEFIDFSELTEEQVISWAQDRHPVENMNSVIERAIEEKKSPKESVEENFPWS